MNTQTKIPGAKKPAFHVPPPKPRVNADELEAFASQAGSSPSTPVIGKKSEPNQKTSAVGANASSSDRTKAFLLRLLPEQFERVEQVFAHSTYKSKQKMGEQLLMEAIDELAKKLGIQ